MNKFAKKMLLISIAIMFSQSLMATREGGGNIEEIKRFTTVARAGVDKIRSMHFEKHAKVLDQSLRKLSTNNAVEIVDRFTDRSGNLVPIGMKDAYSYPSSVQLLGSVWIDRLSSIEEAQKHWVQIIHELFRVEKFEMDDQYSISIGEMQLNKVTLAVKKFEYTLDDWTDYALERQQLATEMIEKMETSSQAKAQALSFMEKLLEKPISGGDKKLVEKLAKQLIQVGKTNFSYISMVFLESIDYLKNGQRTCNSLNVELAFREQQKQFINICENMTPLKKCKTEVVKRVFSAGAGKRCIEHLYFIPESKVSNAEAKAAFYDLAILLRKHFRKGEYRTLEGLVEQMIVLPVFM